jgi:hypothetical protein
MADVVWKGDYVCSACGHRAAAEITGTPNIDYSDPIKKDRLVKFTVGNVPCPKCGARDPAAKAAARNTVLAMAGGFIVAGIIGTIAVRIIMGPMPAGIVSVIAFFVLVFLIVRNLGASGTAKKHIRFV